MSVRASARVRERNVRCCALEPCNSACKPCPRPRRPNVRFTKVPSRFTNTVAAAEIPGVQSLLTLAVFVVVVGGLSLAKEVLVPITLAVLLSFVLAPTGGVAAAAAPAAGAGGGGGRAAGVGRSSCPSAAPSAARWRSLANDAPRYAATIQRQGGGGAGLHRGPPVRTDEKPGPASRRYGNAAVPGAPAAPAAAGAPGDGHAQAAPLWRSASQTRTPLELATARADARAGDRWRRCSSS